MPKKKKKWDLRDLVRRCPYCGSSVHLRSADGIYKDNSRGVMLYVCARYPDCDAYVRVQKNTTLPVGTLANGALRALRLKAHEQFNKLYLSGRMSKHEAYAWLAALLQVPYSQAHIGHLGEYFCQRVIEESQLYMALPAPRKVPEIGGVVCATNRRTAKAG